MVRRIPCRNRMCAVHVTEEDLANALCKLKLYRLGSMLAIAEAKKNVLCGVRCRRRYFPLVGLGKA